MHFYVDQAQERTFVLDFINKAEPSVYFVSHAMVTVALEL